jgi:hypothetical protein
MNTGDSGPVPFAVEVKGEHFRSLAPVLLVFR